MSVRLTVQYNPFDEAIVMAGIRCAVLIIATALNASASLAHDVNLVDIEADIANIRGQIESAELDTQKYSGGLIRALILQRLETLRMTEAMLEQRRIAIREGAEFVFTIPAINPDPDREAQITKDLLVAQQKLATAEDEVARYSGGLVHALALATVMTQRQTVAMLHQAAIAAHYGLAIPKFEASAGRGEMSEQSQALHSVDRATSPPKESPTEQCLEISDFGSSLLDYNEVFAKVAWKVDIQNSCNELFLVRVTFALQDEDEFELDTDSEEIRVPQNGIGKARGQMLVSPASNFDRAKYNGVSYILLD